MRTGKAMTLAHAAQPTTRAGLARVTRVYFGNAQAMFLRLVYDSFTDKAVLPEGEATTQRASAYLPFLRLGHLQVLKDEDSVGRHPRDEGFGSLLRKGARAVALPATKPFEETAHRAGVLLLCLTGRVFGLQPGAGFGRAAVLDFDGSARNEEVPPIRVYRHQGVGLAEVNPNGQHPLWLRHFQGDGHTPNQLAAEFDHGEAIDLFGPSKARPEVLWHGIRQALAPAYRPDGQCAILPEVGIAPTHPYQEQGTSAPEDKRTSRGLVIRAGRGIRPCHQADSRNGHLRRERSFYLMVAGALQGQGTEVLPLIIAGERERMLYFSERLKRAFQIVVCLDDDGDRALDIHRTSVPHVMSGVNSAVWSVGRPSLPKAFAEGTLAAFGGTGVHV
jgi:hypothetical protein